MEAFSKLSLAGSIFLYNLGMEVLSKPLLGSILNNIIHEWNPSPNSLSQVAFYFVTHRWKLSPNLS